MGCACTPRNAARVPARMVLTMVLGSRSCSLVQALEEFLFQGSLVQLWLEVVKPGEEEEEEGPDAR